MTYLPLAGLSLRDIEYVVAVDDLRNFSRAAERCGVSQAGLSEQVRKLEKLLGITLFERSRRHVSPTPEGIHIIELGRDVLALARNFLEVARAHTGPLDGLLRIGVIPTLGPYYIPTLLPKLRDSHPQLSLRLTEDQTERLLSFLKQGELDIAILASPEPSDTLIAEPIFDEPLLAVIPKGHALAKKPKISMSDLSREDLLLLEDGHCLREHALSVCPTNFKPQDQRLATSLEMLWYMTAAGEGMTLIPSLALKNRGELSELVEVRPVADAEASRKICLVWRASDPRTKAFYELAECFRKNVPTDSGCVTLESDRPKKGQQQQH